MSSGSSSRPQSTLSSPNPIKTLAISTSSLPFKIRDFGHPPTDPLHYGIYPVTSPAPSTSSDIDNLFPCHARAMYDFTAQDDSEISFPEGALIYILERKYPGWLLGIYNNFEGLIPENYVAIQDDTFQPSNGPSLLKNGAADQSSFLGLSSISTTSTTMSPPPSNNSSLASVTNLITKQPNS